MQTRVHLSRLGGLALALVLAFTGLGAGPAAAQQSFKLGTRVDITTGAWAYCSAVGDLNGDGIPDLVLGMNALGGLSAYLGTGGGAYGARMDYNTSGTPTDLVLADVNGDGKLDVVLAGYFGNVVSVMLGNGLGGFGQRLDIAAGTAVRFEPGQSREVTLVPFGGGPHRRQLSSQTQLTLVAILHERHQGSSHEQINRRQIRRRNCSRSGLVHPQGSRPPASRLSLDGIRGAGLDHGSRQLRPQPCHQ